MAAGNARIGIFLVCLVMSASLVWVDGAGAGWLPDLRLGEYSIDSDLSPNNAHCVAADGTGRVYLAWSDLRDGNSEIYFKRFDGSTWGPDRRMTRNSAASVNPAVAVDPAGNLHLVWSDESGGSPEIRYKRYNGVTWTATESITMGSERSDWPSIAADAGGHVHLVWWNHDFGVSYIYYAEFDGVSWNAPVILSEPASVSPGAPCVCVDPYDHVHVVWGDFRDGYVEVYYKEFDGTTWSADQRLTVSTEWSRDPCVTSDTEGNLYVFWREESGAHSEIRFMKRVGGIWGPSTLLTPGFGKARAPSAVQGDSGKVHVVWYDSPAGYAEIYYKVFDGTWAPDERLTEISAASTDPHLALDAAGHIHVVWRDERESIPILYYRWWYNGAPPKPDIAYLDPVEWFASDGLRIGSLAGDDFIYGARAWLGRMGEDSLPFTDMVVETGHLITGTLSLAGAVTGWWDLIVANPGGRMDTLNGAFHVLPSIWGEDTRITFDGGSSYLSAGNASCIAADSEGNLHVVFYDDRTGQREVYYKTYDGIAWSPDELVTPGANIDDYPAIAVGPDDSIHLVWSTGPYNGLRPAYSTRTDTGWTEPLLLSEGDYGHSPTLAADSAGNLYAAWGGAYGIYVRMFDGVTWGPAHHFDSPKIERRPALATGPGGRVHLVWEAEDTTEIHDLCYSVLDGLDWSAPVTLESARYLGYPSIAVGPEGNVHVAWQDRRFHSVGDYEIWYKRWDGTGWTPSERLTVAEGWSFDSSIAVDDNGDVYMVLIDERDGNREVYYKRSEGNLWGPSVRLTFDPAWSLRSHCVLDGDGRLHLVWIDARDGNCEIYYKMRDAAALSGIEPEDGGRDRVFRVTVAPNPIRESAEIRLDAAGEAKASVRIYDVQGRAVWNTEAGSSGGSHQGVVWNATDLAGGRVSPGIYFVSLEAGNCRALAKIVVLE